MQREYLCRGRVGLVRSQHARAHIGDAKTRQLGERKRAFAFENARETRVDGQSAVLRDKNTYSIHMLRDARANADEQTHANMNILVMKIRIFAKKRTNTLHSE